MRKPKPKVVLIGAGPTAQSALESLSQDCDVKLVFRSAPSADPVVALAREYGVSVVCDMSMAVIQSAVEELKPDCVVISSYDRILGPKLLGLCKFVNVHYSPLPRYRGRANVNWAIIKGEPAAAISIHTVVPGLDSGNILFQRLIAIDNAATVTELYERLNGIQKEHLGSVVRAYTGGFTGDPQRESEATYGCTRTPADGEINWSAPAAAIHNLIRALQAPYPNAYTFFECRRLRILRAGIVENPPIYEGRIPGRVVSVNREAGSVDVLTGDSVLRIYEVAFENGGTLAAAAAVKSTKDSFGLQTRDLLSRVNELEKRINELVANCGIAVQTTTT